jgi:hypothetical protein
MLTEELVFADLNIRLARLLEFHWIGNDKAVKSI